MVWSVWRGGPDSSRAVWPLWLLAAMTIFLTGFRLGLNVRGSNVIDVGYAGVIGADRIAHGESPYGHMPVEGTLKACGPKDSDGEIRERVQTNGRCESANERGDTYGPVAYEAYVPAYAALGWSGKWDKLPAAHGTAIAFDLLALLGLDAGRPAVRRGAARCHAPVLLGRVSVHAVRVELEHERRDHAGAAHLRLLARDVCLRARRVSRARRRGRSSPRFCSCRCGRDIRRGAASSGKAAFAGGFVAATLAAFSILLLEPNPAHAARVFWDRTFGWQVGRDSPFSIWGWGQYHAAGIPDLGFGQQVVIGLLAVGAVACYFVPRRKTPLQLAALTAALLIGFELSLTHWFYLYIPWFFPFVAFVVLAPRRRREAAPPPSDSEARELVPAG